MLFSKNNTEGNLTVKNSALVPAGALFWSITALVVAFVSFQLVLVFSVHDYSILSAEPK